MKNKANSQNKVIIKMRMMIKRSIMMKMASSNGMLRAVVMKKNKMIAKIKISKMNLIAMKKTFKI